MNETGCCAAERRAERGAAHKQQPSTAKMPAACGAGTYTSAPATCQSRSSFLLLPRLPCPLTSGGMQLTSSSYSLPRTCRVADNRSSGRLQATAHRTHFSTSIVRQGCDPEQQLQLAAPQVSSLQEQAGYHSKVWRRRPGSDAPQTAAWASAPAARPPQSPAAKTMHKRATVKAAEGFNGPLLQLGTRCSARVSGLQPMACAPTCTAAQNQRTSLRLHALQSRLLDRRPALPGCTAPSRGPPPAGRL